MSRPMTSTTMSVALTCSATVLTACVPAFGADRGSRRLLGRRTAAQHRHHRRLAPAPLAAQNDLSWRDFARHGCTRYWGPSSARRQLNGASYDADLGRSSAGCDKHRRSARAPADPSDRTPGVHHRLGLPRRRLPVWLAHAGIDVAPQPSPHCRRHYAAAWACRAAIAL